MLDISRGENRETPKGRKSRAEGRLLKNKYQRYKNFGSIAGGEHTHRTKSQGPVKDRITKIAPSLKKKLVRSLLDIPRGQHFKAPTKTVYLKQIQI